MILHILHVSDLHGRPDRRHDIEIVLKALRQCITDTLSRTGWSVDLICFTGDLANKGQPEEYEFAQSVFLDPLLGLLKVDKNRFFMVPGNHDVQRVLHGPDLDYENSLLAKLTGRDAVNELLDLPTERERAFARLRAYKSFASSYLPCIPASEDPMYACVRTIRIGDSNLAIGSLNSAWRCNSDEDFRRLLIGERQVDCAGAKMRQAELRISLVHHPFGWLCDFDERDSSRRALAESDVILSGHVHDPLPMVQQTPHGCSLFSSAGAVFEGRKFNGFSIIELNTETFEGTVFLFRYYDDRRAFDKDLFTVEDGTFPFRLARSSATKREMRVMRTPSRDDAIAIKDDAKKRERVTFVYGLLRKHRGGPWALGVALGLVVHSPSRTSGELNTTVSLLELAATDNAVAAWLRCLTEAGHALRETEDDLLSVTELFVRQVEVAKELWPNEGQQPLLAQFDRVVETLIQVDSSVEDILPAKLLTIDELLQEKQYDKAIENLRSLDTYNPLVRAKLIEALHNGGKHREVLAVVSSAPRETLGQTEIEHCIWSSSDIKEFETAADLLLQHERFETISARVFRRAVLEKFPSLIKFMEARRKKV